MDNSFISAIATSSAGTASSCIAASAVDCRLWRHIICSQHVLNNNIYNQLLEFPALVSVTQPSLAALVLLSVHLRMRHRMARVLGVYVAGNGLSRHRWEHVQCYKKAFVLLMCSSLALVLFDGGVRLLHRAKAFAQHVLIVDDRYGLH